MSNNHPSGFPVSIHRADALELIKKHLPLNRTEQIPVYDCSGRTAAEHVYSEISLPEHDRSAMDGFAVCSSDTASASIESPVVLNFSGEIRPSCATPAQNGIMSATRVLTGGIIPQGTDSVIPFERVAVNGDSISITAPVEIGSYIRKCGSDIFKGDAIVDSGCIISPCDAALLAYAGFMSADVTCIPSVTVLAVGNELCDPSKKKHNGLIPADNLVLMKGLCTKYGIKDIKTSPCENSPQAIAETITGNNSRDLIITTGGTGPGNRDFVFNSVLMAGGVPLFKGLAMHPAKSIFACMLGNSLVIGLPGPPIAVNLAFHTVINPAIKMMQRMKNVFSNVTAVLTESLKGALDREKLRPCRISEDNGNIWADPLLSKDLSPRKIMSISNGIIVLPPGCENIKAGTNVSVIRFG